MRAIKIFIWLVFLITTSAIAQEADSIVVTYDNQQTIIPMPDLGKKTTIKMADSVQVIEIDVSRRKLTDLPYSALYSAKNTSSEKSIIKTKWFSEIEAGYVIGFVSKDRFPAYTNTPNWVYHINNDPWLGFNLGLSIFDRERILNSSLSYDLGLKLGIATYYRNQKPVTELPDDTINQIHHFYVDYNTYKLTRLQLLFPFGMHYSFLSGKSISKISFGTSIGTALNIESFRYQDDGIFRSETFLSPIVLQPYLGFEYGKIGLLSTLGVEMINGYLAEIRFNLGFSLTYRFF